MESLRKAIEEAWQQRELLKTPATRTAVKAVLAHLDNGELRCAEPTEDGWQVNDWVKKAVILYFPIAEMRVMEAGPYEYHDKIPLKGDYQAAGVRVVPPATARFGAHIERNVILMPSYVNIGAYIGSGSMIDTWETVGSCAQIGPAVHV